MKCSFLPFSWLGCSCDSRSWKNNLGLRYLKRNMLKSPGLKCKKNHLNYCMFESLGRSMLACIPTSVMYLCFMISFPKTQWLKTIIYQLIILWFVNLGYAQLSPFTNLSVFTHMTVGSWWVCMRIISSSGPYSYEWQMTGATGAARPCVSSGFQEVQVSLCDYDSKYNQREQAPVSIHFPHYCLYHSW